MLSSIEALLPLVRSSQPSRSPLRNILFDPTHLNPNSLFAISHASTHAYRLQPSYPFATFSHESPFLRPLIALANPRF